MRSIVNKLSHTIKQIGIVSGEDHMTAPVRVPRRLSSCFDDTKEEDNVHTKVDGAIGQCRRRHRRITMTMTTMPTTVTSLTLWENSSVLHPWPRLLSTLITLLAPSTPMLTSIASPSSLTTPPPSPHHDRNRQLDVTREELLTYDAWESI